MEADPSRNRTELDHFLAVLTQADDDGEPFIVVGGHAVNYWAKLLSAAGAAIAFTPAVHQQRPRRYRQ